MEKQRRILQNTQTPLRRTNTTNNHPFDSQLQVEEKENVFSSESARRCVSVLTTILRTPVSNSVRIRIHNIVNKWLTKSEDYWIEAIHSCPLFELTLEVAKLRFNHKSMKDKVFHAFILRLDESPTPPNEWLQWLCLKKSEYFALADFRPSFHRLLMVLIKWLKNNQVVVDLCKVFLNLSTVLVGLSSYEELCSQLKRELECSSVGLVGSLFTMDIVFNRKDGGGVQYSSLKWVDNKADDESWMHLAVFALHHCRQPRMLPIFKQHVMPMLEPVLKRSMDSTLWREVLLEAMHVPDLGLKVQLVQLLEGRRHLLNLDSVVYPFALALQQVGSVLIIDQVIRYGTVLLTNDAFSLTESDFLEAMLLSDIEFLHKDSQHVFQIERHVLEIAHSCYWPSFSPVLATAAQTLTVRCCPASLTDTLNQLFQTRRCDDAHKDPLLLGVPSFARCQISAPGHSLRSARRFLDRVLDGRGTEELKVEYILERDERDQGDFDYEGETWLYFWACRALTLTSLKSRHGTARETFQFLEHALRDSEKTMLLLLWILFRELILFAPHNSDAKLALFFAVKNAEVCQSWLSHLVSRSYGVLPISHQVFYYMHYQKMESRLSLSWTVSLLESLSECGHTSAVKGWLSQRQIASSLASKSFAMGISHFSQGAFCRAKQCFGDVEDVDDVVRDATARLLAGCDARLLRWKQEAAAVPLTSFSSLGPFPHMDALQRAVDSSDFELTSLLFDCASRSPRQVSFPDPLKRIELGQKLVAYPDSIHHVNFLCPQGTLERKLMDKAQFSFEEISQQLDGEENGVALRCLAFQSLAAVCTKALDFKGAARCYAQSGVVKDSETFFRYLCTLDRVSEDEGGEIPPAHVMKPHVDQLLCRNRSFGFAHQCLLVLAHAFPKEMAWHLVSHRDENNSNVEDLFHQLPRRIQQETEMLSQALIEASRSRDEEFDEVFDSLAHSKKKLSPPVLQELCSHLFSQHFALPTRNVFETRFRDSPCGQLIQKWLLNPELPFDAAKESLVAWLQANGFQRSAVELSPALSRAYAVLPFVFDEGVLGDVVHILKTKTRPRRMDFTSFSGLHGRFLLKSGEDLRLDARVNALFALIMHEPPKYRVLPLSRKVGLIEWVSHAVPLLHAYQQQHKAELPILDELEEDKLDRFRQRRQTANSSESLKSMIWTLSNSPEAWFSKVDVFSRTCGETSMLGWLVGLGDRHLDNLLLDSQSGQVIHIDLNVCFNKGRMLKVPETVPFRLTNIIQGALWGGSLPDGPFAHAMTNTWKRIQTSKADILNFLEIFILDPISSKRSVFWNLEEVEFESAKKNFLEKAQTWLESPLIAATLSNLISFPEEGELEDEASPRLVLERARSSAHRAQMECDRWKEKAGQAFDLVNSFPMEKIKHMECLHRCVLHIKRCTSLAKMNLPCCVWSVRLKDALRCAVLVNGMIVMNWTLEQPFSNRVVFDEEDVLVLKDAQQVESNPKIRALLDAILLLHALNQDEAKYAILGWEALKSAANQVNLSALKTACSEVPRWRAAEDDALVVTQGVKETVEYVKRTVDYVSTLVFEGKEAKRDTLFAHEANLRVQQRMEEEEQGLVFRLIEEATSDLNLSQMYEGWMAHI